MALAVGQPERFRHVTEGAARFESTGFFMSRHRAVKNCRYTYLRGVATRRVRLTTGTQSPGGARVIWLRL